MSGDMSGDMTLNEYQDIAQETGGVIGGSGDAR